MSRPRSIYVVFMSYLCDASSSFYLWLIVQFHEYRQTCSFAYFLGCAVVSLDDNVDEECE